MSDVVDMRRPQRLLVDRRGGDGVDLVRHGELHAFLDVLEGRLAAHRLHLAHLQRRHVDIVEVDDVDDAILITAVRRIIHAVQLCRQAADLQRLRQDLLVADHDDIGNVLDLVAHERLDCDLRTDAGRISHRYSDQWLFHKETLLSKSTAASWRLSAAAAIFLIQSTSLAILFRQSAIASSPPIMPPLVTMRSSGFSPPWMRP